MRGCVDGAGADARGRAAVKTSQFAKKQHPMYQTSASEYGRKDVGKADKPTKYFPRSNHFSHSFAGGMFKDYGLTTTMPASRVHKELDGAF